MDGMGLQVSTTDEVDLCSASCSADGKNKKMRKEMSETSIEQSSEVMTLSFNFDAFRAREHVHPASRQPLCEFIWLQDTLYIY